jgi:hypothetical protein
MPTLPSRPARTIWSTFTSARNAISTSGTHFSHLTSLQQVIFSIALEKSHIFAAFWPFVLDFFYLCTLFEPRTVATLALTARRSHHSVRSHPQNLAILTLLKTRRMGSKNILVNFLLLFLFKNKNLKFDC